MGRRPARCYRYCKNKVSSSPLSTPRFNVLAVGSADGRTLPAIGFKLQLYDSMKIRC